MTPVKQKNRHDPENGIWGDCMRACLASLLDLPIDDVPHAYDQGREDEGHEIVRAFLARLGLTRVCIPFDGAHGLDGVLATMRGCNAGVHHLIVGRSRSGCNHVCIGHDGEIVHDPSIDQSGIIGPCDDGFYWIEFLAHLSLQQVDQEAATYPAPAHGWNCFHCGAHFGPTLAGQHAARLHFGPTPASRPSCIMAAEEHGILRQLRWLEGQHARQLERIAGGAS